ncbi:MAG: hypothetical protein PHW40_00945 [Candidatus Izemoplasmatales bacterium]|jgi:hypothetical protein|nr:hypothetical protein [Candidatus Izemoplasmatales bacterium]MDD5292860.1 hypothetical protein [Candidatus Izemoplasmatales bacterium]
MKRLLLVLMFAVLLLIGCSRASPEPYIQMDPLESPIQMQVKFKSALLIYQTENLWITHQLKLNYEQCLYYAPKTARVDGNYYMNKEATYFIRSGTEESGYTYERIDIETVRELLRE